MNQVLHTSYPTLLGGTRNNLSKSHPFCASVPSTARWGPIMSLEPFGKALGVWQNWTKLQPMLAEALEMEVNIQKLDNGLPNTQTGLQTLSSSSVGLVTKPSQVLAPGQDTGLCPLLLIVHLPVIGVLLPACPGSCTSPVGQQ